MKATGIDNIGNTCYLNSAIQALFFSPSLTNVLIQEKEKFTFITNEVFVKYNEIIFELFKKRTPNKTLMRDFMSAFLKEHPHYEIMTRHHDSHETLLAIIDSLDEAIKPINDIKQIFDTNIIQKITCHKCKHTVKTEYKIRNLSIENKCTSIQEGFDEQFKEEKLDGYKCDNCKEEKCTSLKSIKSLPKHIIVNINLFDMHGRKQKTRTEINDTIIVNGKEYGLYATLCHHGSSQFGHYTANCISRGERYMIDDETVSVTKSDKKFKFNAYTLLFRQTN